MDVELHDGRLGNLHVLGAMGIAGRYYESGLLHPLIDYEKPMPWLKSIYDPMDNNGLVTIPAQPGLGWDLDRDYIKNNLV
jgi:L-alanine-DL-glutamate epimerase-like enolase superfamily enzyme